MKPTQTHHILFSLSLFFIHSLYAADVTAGPLAPVTLGSETAYSTARACAAGCLVFNGVWACGVNAGYYDLAVKLECGCSPINACYCSAGLASSATNYIQSCVSSACDGVGNVGDEVTAMLGLYDGYCATANAALSSATPSAAVSESTTSVQAPVTSGDTARSESTAMSSAAPGTTAATSTPTSSSTTSSEKDNGLSKSDIIALGTGLGVGIPSLLIGALALWFQMKKKKKERKENAVELFQTGSYAQILPPPTPTPPSQMPLGWQQYGGQEQGQIWHQNQEQAQAPVWHEVDGKSHGQAQVFELGDRGMRGKP